MVHVTVQDNIWPQADATWPDWITAKAQVLLQATGYSEDERAETEGREPGASVLLSFPLHLLF